MRLFLLESSFLFLNNMWVPLSMFELYIYQEIHQYSLSTLSRYFASALKQQQCDDVVKKVHMTKIPSIIKGDTIVLTQ